jgi:glycerol-3-phosphate O-acyltransferase
MSRGKLQDYVGMIYPYLRSELFLHWNRSQLEAKVNEYVDYFLKQGMLTEDDDILVRPERETGELQQFILLSETLQNMLKRFSIVLTLLVGSRQTNQQFTRRELESNSQTLAERLAILYDINAPEAFDKNVFSTLVSLLRERGAITTTEDGKLIMGEPVTILHRTILALLPYSVEQQLQQFTKLNQ